MRVRRREAAGLYDWLLENSKEIGRQEELAESLLICDF